MNLFIRWLALIMTAFVAGCATHHGENPPKEQGWIGGGYKCAKSRYTLGDRLFGCDHTINCFPPALEPARNAGILTTALGTNTPAFRAGLREGDLILEVAHQPVTRLPDFWRIIRATPPGTALPVKAYRAGQMADHVVTVGRETYREGGVLNIGLMVHPLHLVPTSSAPRFSLMVLGWQRDRGTPTEFDTVEQRYWQSCHPKAKPSGFDGEWSCWLALVGVEKGKNIISQELVEAAPAVY